MASVYSGRPRCEGKRDAGGGDSAGSEWFVGYDKGFIPLQEAHLEESLLPVQDSDCGCDVAARHRENDGIFPGGDLPHVQLRLGLLSDLSAAANCAALRFRDHVQGSQSFENTLDLLGFQVASNFDLGPRLDGDDFGDRFVARFAERDLVLACSESFDRELRRGLGL